MRERLLLVVLGVALGVILAVVVLARLGQGGVVPAPSRGDAGQPYDLELVVTETFLAAQLANPAGGGASVGGQAALREPEVRLLADGTVQVRGRATFYGLETTVRVVLLPRVAGGRLEVAIVESRAGGIKVPTDTAARVEATLNARLAEAMAKRPYQVVALVPDAGTLALRLK